MKRTIFTPVTMLCYLLTMILGTGIQAQTSPKDGQKVTITIETKDKNGNKSVKKEVHTNENLSDADIDRIVDGYVKENEGKDVKVNVDIAEEKPVSSEGNNKSKVIIKRQKKGDNTDEIKDEDIKIIINGKEMNIKKDSLDKDMIIIDGEGGTSFFNLSPEGMFKKWGLSDTSMDKVNGFFRGFNNDFFDGKKHGFLGVTEGKDKTDAKGFIIGSITKDSPAEKAGLQAGDIITSLGGQPVNSFSEIRTEIRKHEPGEEVEIKYTRDGKESTMKVALGESKESMAFESMPEGFRFESPDLNDLPNLHNIPDMHSYNWEMPQGNQGFSWDDHDSNKPQLGVQVKGNGNKGGVEVQEVVEGSAAYYAGIHEGDIITKINNKKVDSPEELVAKIQNHEPGDEIKVQFLRDGKKKTINIVLGRQKRGYSYGYNSPDMRKKKTYVFNGKGENNDQLIDAGTLKLDNFEVYPNPSEGKVNIKFHSPSDNEMTLKVVDVNGKVIYTEDLKPVNGDYNKSLELQNAKNGVYILRIEQDGKISSEKIIMNNK